MTVEAGVVMGTRLFLHKLDPASRTGTFVRTSVSALRAAAFLDGRTCYWEESPLEREVAPIESDVGVDRFIFHVGFCGSTLLARLLDQPGRTLVLREPQSLTDIAAYRSALDREGLHDPNLSPMLATVRACLHRPWQAHEHVVIKPSNWVNVLLPDLVCATSTRPLFLTMERRAFVRAILRGGAARIAFAARAAVHMSNSSDANAARIANALARPVSDYDRLLTLAALLHDFQLERFSAAARVGGWPSAHWLTLEQIRADPPSALHAAALALDIDPPPADRSWMEHAKQPGVAYSIDAETEHDAALEAEHGPRISRTLAWIDESPADVTTPCATSPSPKSAPRRHKERHS